MKIIIIGCGKVGSTLAKSLANENHNIVVVDANEKIVNDVTSVVDCMGVVGNGAIQKTLIDAGVNDADYLIACTNSDEINILSCLFARKTSKCKTIARIRNPEYSKQINYIKDELDISMTINPELAAANEILRILRYSSSISSDSFFKGRLNLLKVDISKNSELIGKKLYEIPNRYDLNIIICVVERNEDVFVPSGNFTIEEGDKISFVADHPNAIKFFDALGYEYKQLKSFMIVGISKITQYLIDLLNNKNHNISIKVIDKNVEKCNNLAGLYKNVSIVCADATDKNMLIKEGLEDTDAFLTLTGMDEENVILSLYAKKNTHTKIITKINHLNFIESLKEIDVGSIINPERIAANIIISHLRGSNNAINSNIETLYKICKERVEALGFNIHNDSKVTNVALKDLKLKKNILIAGIYRDHKVIIPNGYEQILVGDRVVIISKDNAVTNIEDILDV